MIFGGTWKGFNIRILLVPGRLSQTKAKQWLHFFYLLSDITFFFFEATLSFHCLTNFRPHFWDDFISKELFWSAQNISILQGDTIEEHTGNTRSYFALPSLSMRTRNLQGLHQWTDSLFLSAAFVTSSIEHHILTGTMRTRQKQQIWAAGVK